MIGFAVVVDAWTATMGRACWQGGLVVIAVWTICRLVRSMPAGLQCWFWRLAILKFAAVLLLPFALGVPLLPPIPSALDGTGIAVESSGPASQTDHEQANRLPAGLLCPRVWFCLAWATGGGWNLTRLLIAWHAARRLRKRGRPVEHAAILEQLASCGRSFGLRATPELLEVAGDGSPMLVGVLRPAIVVPAETWSRLTPPERAMVLGHELAHLRRADVFWGLVAALVRSVFFFHPLVWLSHGRLNLSQEMAADELAINLQRHDPMSYGKLLVSVVGKLSPGRLIPVMSMGTTGPMGSLKRRLIAMSLVGTTSGRVRFTSVLILSVVIVFGIVPWRLVAAEPETKEKPVAGKPTVDPVRYIAEVKFVRVAQKGTQTTTINTVVGGTKGTPLKTALGGKDGVTIKLEMEDVPGVSPAQAVARSVVIEAKRLDVIGSANRHGRYVARLRVIEAKQDGKENVLSAPKLTVFAGQPASLMVGEVSPDGTKGDRIEIDLTVTELPPAGQKK